MIEFIRPGAAQTLRRWREVIIAGVVTALGLWVALQGGPVLLIAGLLIAALGAALAVTGLRRLHFMQDINDPGLVQVVEGQITYFGPTEGGFAGLSSLTEIALTQHGGRRCWRLANEGGEVLFIPTAAEGTDALFDAFSGLPGLETPALLAAIDGPPDMPRIVWRRRLARMLH